ncbi:glycosyltransferase family 2 protein [Brevibacterium sp. 50QC2O2]|uniref:glycosyltransferase family 2 protein n=1 Tax=Brevibacterium sp. 50QC2O2 TaxID=2968459 RepID=UPI00211C2D18|nr:glycosyltransferase family A protein [Brevibacterium sp. 50QC2O2]MCQ9388078.1 glycosyltransferase family 2 protein [Brevibacterium sp. 50QC2O2]
MRATVSVIIPTVGRPSLVKAVDSVLQQVDCETEPIVILDSPDKLDYVRAELSDRNYMLEVQDHRGACAARNLGLDLAQGEYIGYLDDDDTWMPTKAITQIAAIRKSGRNSTISVVASRFVREDGTVSDTAPEVFKANNEAFGNYLVKRTRLRYGSAQFNTPAVLGSSDIMKRFRWDEDLGKHQDWDLLIRLMADLTITCIAIPDTLVSVSQGSSGSISKSMDWTKSTTWLRKHAKDVTGRARSDFVALHILLPAILSRSRKGIGESFRWLNVHPPHFAAMVRLLAGIAMKR